MIAAHGLGHVRVVFANFDARDGGADGFGFAAVGVARLGTERFEGAGATLHPEHDAGHALLAELTGFERHQFAPTESAGGDAGRRDAAEEVPPADHASAPDVQIDLMSQVHRHGNLRESLENVNPPAGR